MTRPKPVNHRAWWVLFFLFMTVLALVVRWHVVQLNREVRREGLSSQIYINTRSLLIDVLDIETGLRGFLIVGKPEYLRPYHEGLGRLDANLSTLRTMTISDPTELPHVRAAEEGIGKVLEEFSSQAQLAEDEGVEAARKRFYDFPTKPLVDIVREHLLAIQVQETRKINEATATLDAQMLATVWLINSFTAVCVILLIAMIVGAITSPSESGTSIEIMARPDL